MCVGKKNLQQKITQTWCFLHACVETPFSLKFDWKVVYNEIPKRQEQLGLMIWRKRNQKGWKRYRHKEVQTFRNHFLVKFITVSHLNLYNNNQKDIKVQFYFLTCIEKGEWSYKYLLLSFLVEMSTLESWESKKNDFYQ